MSEVMAGTEVATLNGQECEALSLPSGAIAYMATRLTGKHLRQVKQVYARVIEVKKGADGEMSVSGFNYANFIDEVFKALPIFCLGIKIGEKVLDPTLETYDSLAIADAEALEDVLQERISTLTDKKK